MKSASMPIAAAARMSGRTNERSPPLHVPLPPGFCTLCVASNMTGTPSERMTGSERKSTESS